MALTNLIKTTTRATQSEVESIKNLQIMFLICVGVITIFITTGLRSGNTTLKSPIYTVIPETGNENSHRKSNFEPDHGKTENERKRDEIFLEYAKSIKTLEQLGILNRTSRLPDVICAGVEKCGTGALGSFLSSHPMVKYKVKEPHFFGTNKYELGLEYYKSLLPNVTSLELALEKTPAYFDKLPEIPEVIKRDVPNAKIIIVLCDPVIRTYSDYVHEIIMGNVGKHDSYELLATMLLAAYHQNLNELIDDDEKQINYISSLRQSKMISHILTLGLYYYHLVRWFKVYDRSQIHIVNGDELIENPAKVIKELQTFLNLPEFIIPEDFTMHESGFYCVSSPKTVVEDGRLTVTRSPRHCLTGGKGRTRKGRSGTPSKRATKQFRKFYAPFNEKLYKLLGRRFNW